MERPAPASPRPQWTLRTLLIVVIVAAVAVVAYVAVQQEERNRLIALRYASGGGRYLKTLATAQADFRANDRDNDGEPNFWIRDVYGLFALCPQGGPVDPDHMIKLIEPTLAAADADPARLPDVVDIAATGIGPFEPKGYYRYVAMTHYENGAYDHAGNGKNFGKYAFCAYPVGPRPEGHYTFIMDETITIWKKHTGGRPVRRMPANPAAEGWTKID